MTVSNRTHHRTHASVFHLTWLLWHQENLFLTTASITEDWCFMNESLNSSETIAIYNDFWGIDSDFNSWLFTSYVFSLVNSDKQIVQSMSENYLIKNYFKDFFLMFNCVHLHLLLAVSTCSIFFIRLRVHQQSEAYINYFLTLDCSWNRSRCTTGSFNSV